MTTILLDVQVAVDTSKLYVEVDALNSVLLYQWKGRLGDSEAKAGFAEIVDLIMKHRITYLIADLHKFEGGTVETANWINDTLSETLKATNLKKIATTVPESAFGEFSNRFAMGEKMVSLHQIEKFTNSQDAYEWFGIS